MSTQPQITVCPPAPQKDHFDQHIFDGRRPLAVAAEYTPEGWNSTGLSFNDYSRCHIARRKGGYKRLPTPIWALDDKLLREVIVRYLEYRNYIYRPTGNLEERIAKVEASVKERLPEWVETLRRFYKNGTTDIEIQNLDSRIVLERKGFAGLVASVVYLSYRLNYNSVNVAEATGLKPPHVRIILYRLRKIWTEIEAGRARRRQPGKVHKAPITPERLELLWNERHREGSSWGSCARVMGHRNRETTCWMYRRFFDGPSAWEFPGKRKSHWLPAEQNVQDVAAYKEEDRREDRVTCPL
jgi:hypothetical protein